MPDAFRVPQSYSYGKYSKQTDFLIYCNNVVIDWQHNCYPACSGSWINGDWYASKMCHWSVSVESQLLVERPWWCFKNTYELLNLAARKFSRINKLHTFQCMCTVFGVKFQFHTKYLAHTLKETIFIEYWKFKSSQIYESKAFMKRSLGLGGPQMYGNVTTVHDVLRGVLTLNRQLAHYWLRSYNNPSFIETMKLKPVLTSQSKRTSEDILKFCQRLINPFRFPNWLVFMQDFRQSQESIIRYHGVTL